MSDTWLSVAFKELSFVSGNGINPYDFPDEEFELYSVPAHLSGEPEIVKGNQVRSNKQLVSEGMVLLCKINPRINRTWVVKEASGRRQIASTEWIVFSRTSFIFPSYLSYFMRQTDFRDFLAINASGVGGSLMRVKPTTLFNYLFRVPGTRTQTAIVEKLEELLSDIDAGISALERAKANLKRYRASVLKAAVEGRLTAEWRKQNPAAETGAQLLARILKERRAKWEENQLKKFTEQGKTPPKNWRDKYPEPASSNIAGLPELPEGWVWSTFEAVSERVTVGHVGSMKNEYITEGIPFLRSQNVRPNRFDPEGLKFISSTFHCQLEKSALAPGDIVVVRSGSVGISCVIPDYMKIANCSDLVIVKSPTGIISNYGAYYMNSVVDTRVAAGKVGVALTHFNTKSVAEMPVPIASLVEQIRIVNEVESRFSIADATEKTIESVLARAAHLRQAILKRAFEGRLVPQDPNDESASVLLERIRAERLPQSPSQRVRKNMVKNLSK